MTKKLVKATLPLIPGEDYILHGSRSVTFIGPSHIDPKYGVFYCQSEYMYRPFNYDYIYREVKTKTMWSYTIDWGDKITGSVSIFDSAEEQDRHIKDRLNDGYKCTPFSFELEE